MGSRTETPIAKLPSRPTTEIGFRAQSQRIDIPRVCWGCTEVLTCPPSRIAIAECSFNLVKNEPATSACQACADFLPDPVQLQ